MIYTRRGKEIDLTADKYRAVLDWADKFTSYYVARSFKVNQGYRVRLVKNENSTTGRSSVVTTV